MCRARFFYQPGPISLNRLQGRVVPLVDLPVPRFAAAVPGDVRSFLREAEKRISEFQRSGRFPGFVPSDYHGIYGVLCGLAESDRADRGFCEWGSGFGVVACLAAMLDFDAVGIEIEEELVDAARQFAEDFGLPVEFVHDSFIPADYQPISVAFGEFSWLVTERRGAHQELTFEPEEFDIIFAYPWPDDERATADLFERYAADHAVLLTYHESDRYRLRRKAGRARRLSRLRR
jgi:hypothetical protein